MCSQFFNKNRVLVFSFLMFVFGAQQVVASLPIGGVENDQFVQEEIDNEDFVDFNFFLDSDLSILDTELIYLGFQGDIDLDMSGFMGPDLEVASLGNMHIAKANSGRFKKAYRLARDFWSSQKRREKYLVINLNSSKGGYKYYLSYVVDMKSKKLSDWFVSLRGYNGIGCGRGQTPPGFLEIMNRGAKGRKSHWGNGKRYWLMRDIKASGFTGCRNSMRREVLMHSNVNMKPQRSNGRSRSGGCFTVSPSTFSKWANKLKGNSIVFNTKNI